MKKLMFILVMLPLLHGCGESATATENKTPDVTCAGFGSPSVTIFVKDSLNDAITIETANVSIHLQDGSGNVIEATYIPDDDSNLDTEQYSYWAPLDESSSEFKFGIVVSEPNYHSFVNKNILFTLDTTCGAVNRVSYTIYLCPLGTSCM